MPLPRVFVGSSVEGLEVARAIQQNLDRDAECRIWTDGVFSPATYFMEALEAEAANTDCGIFVLTPDDLISVRGGKAKAPRDNVIFELGLFSGKLGRRRVLIVEPRGQRLRLPSDLDGVSTIGYRHPGETEGDLKPALGAACTEIRRHLERLSERDAYISWDETIRLTNSVAALLRKSAGSGGYRFQAIVGLSRGGVTVADMLSRIFGGGIPIVCLWAEVDETGKEYNFSPPGNWINTHVLSVLADNRIKDILLVDDAATSGRTLHRAKTFLTEALPSKRVRTLALLTSTDCERAVDYSGRTTDRQLHTPFVMVEQS